jgi:uncharacterized membrane protein (DUF441 family)
METRVRKRNESKEEKRMNFNIDALMSNGLVLIPLVTAIVQMIKMVMPERMFKWSPFIAIAVSILLSILFMSGNDDYNITQGVAQGLIIGLGSSGLYSGLKTTMQNGEKTID